MEEAKISERCVSKRSCKTIALSNKKKSNGHFLPEEVVFHILVWLPTAVLYNCMSYVCRQWYNIIRTPLFIKEHLLRCKPGFLFHFHSENYLPSLINFGESDIDLTELNWRHPHLIVASGDGLVLVKHSDKDFDVANLLTKQTIHLPPFFESLASSGRSNFSFVCGCSDSSYKVFISYYPEGSITIRCAIINVGGDCSWEVIDCPHNIYRIHTLCAGRIIYWCSEKTFAGLFRRNFRKSSRILLAFDVESKTFYRVRSPALDHKKHECFYMEREKQLSILVRVGQENVFDVWLMSKAWDANSGFEWKKQYTFDLGSLAISGDHVYSCRYPEAWLNNGEVVIFRNKNGCFISHNVKTGRTFKFGREYGPGTWPLGFFSEFSYSLVWFSSPC